MGRAEVFPAQWDKVGPRVHEWFQRHGAPEMASVPLGEFDDGGVWLSFQAKYIYIHTYIHICIHMYTCLHTLYTHVVYISYSI